MHWPDQKITNLVLYHKADNDIPRNNGGAR